MALKDQYDLGEEEKDRGTGDVERFPTKDLERLYTAGSEHAPVMIRGKQLNDLTHTTDYEDEAWYAVAEDGMSVDKL